MSSAATAVGAAQAGSRNKRIPGRTPHRKETGRNNPGPFSCQYALTSEMGSRIAQQGVGHGIRLLPDSHVTGVYFQGLLAVQALGGAALRGGRHQLVLG